MMRLALGTVQFGLPYGIANQDGQVSRVVAKDMLQYAVDNGIDTLDTAIAYGDSEACLGEIGCKDFKLVTKLPAVPDQCNDITKWVSEQVSASLRRMGVNSVYGLLLHRSEQLLGPDGKLIFKVLQNLRATGQVQKIGVSIYAPSELDVLTQYRFDLVQAPFNLIDRRLLTSGWLQRLKQEGVEIHTRSAFLQGLLLMSRSGMPAKFAPWAGIWSKWYEWIDNHSLTAVEATLAYPHSFPEIDRVVIGADSKHQLEQIVCAVRGSIPKDLPDLHSDDENLINPANWSKL